MEGERRVYERHCVAFPVRIDGAGKSDRLGMVHNTSASGMLLGTQSHFVPGQEVVLKFRVRIEQRQEMAVRGKVVRVRVADDRDIFRRMTAVRFHSLVPQLEALLQGT